MKRDWPVDLWMAFGRLVCWAGSTVVVFLVIGSFVGCGDPT